MIVTVIGVVVNRFTVEENRTILAAIVLFVIKVKVVAIEIKGSILKCTALDWKYL